MDIVIRLIQTQAEYQAVEEVQRAAWGMHEREVVPGSLLLTAQRHGGLVLGAFTPDSQLVGFVFGFVGRDAAKRLHHHSHMTAVMPTWQRQQLGYRLKLAQREHVLQQGIDMISWTYDPLQSRNAYLNIHKLGAICHTYLPNLYGTMDDTLNADLPSDRFEVQWQINSSHVVTRLGAVARTAAALPNVQVLNPSLPGALRHPAPSVLDLNDQRALVEIPADLEAIKVASSQIARAWRLQTRALFQTAFAAGYTVTDLFVVDGRSYYLLENDWRFDEH